MDPTPQQTNETPGVPGSVSQSPVEPEARPAQPQGPGGSTEPRVAGPEPSPLTPQGEQPASATGTSSEPISHTPPVNGMQSPYQPTIVTPGMGAAVQGGDFPVHALTEPQPAAVLGTDPASAAPKRSRKKLWLLGGVAALVVLLAGGAVFGLYLPNTPSNVYSTGINRSGKALDNFMSTATDQKQLKKYTSSAITGSLQAKLGGGEYDGDFSTTFDKANLNGGLNVTLKNTDIGNKTISAKVISKLPDDSLYPNVYFQVSGYKDLGLDGLLPGISAYDGSWIKVDSTYLQSIGQQFIGSSDNTKAQVTASDISELAKTATSVTRQYVFTTQNDKNVLVKQSYVGKEKMDGLTVYHYKVSVNLDHAKAYCTALGNAVMGSNAYKKLSGQSASDIAAAKKDSAKGCAASVGDSIKSSDRYDMWIDGKYKLIHKVRFYDRTDKASYTDVGQTYKGGDDVTFFADEHDATGKVDGSATLNVNPKTNTVLGTFKVTGTGSDAYSVNGSIKAVASNKPVTVTEPASSIPLQDVLSKFGLAPGTNTTSNDTQSTFEGSTL